MYHESRSTRQQYGEARYVALSSRRPFLPLPFFFRALLPGGKALPRLQARPLSPLFTRHSPLAAAAALALTLHSPLSTLHLAAQSAATATISTIAGTGNAGYSAADDGGPATAAQLDNPWSVAVDGSGNVYIADRGNNRIRKVDASTGNISTFAAGLGQPYGVAVDRAGNVYIAEQSNDRILKVDASTGTTTTFAGGGSSLGDGGPATAAQLNFPVGMTADGAGNIYIADVLNDRIRKVDTAGEITTVAGTGTSGNSGDGGPATAARLNLPYDVAVDGAGNLYIAEQGNRRVRKVDTAGMITAFAGTGANGSSGDGGPATEAQLREPLGVAVDGAGNVYIADQPGRRVRKVDTAGVITTFAGTGVPGDSGDGGPPEEAQFRQPTDVAVDSAGNVYIVDQTADRVRKVTIPPPPAPPGPEPPPTVLSQSFTLSFLPAQGGEPAAQTLTIYAQGSAADFEAIPSARWIEAAPRSGTLAAGAQTTITVTVNPAGLSEGTYRGRLYIRSGGRVTATIRIMLEVPPPAGPAVSQAGGIVNAARMSAYGGRGLFGPQLLPLAPGSTVVVQGVNFAPGGDVVAAGGYPLPTMLSGTRVLIDGAEAPLFAVGPRRIEAQLPWALGGEALAAGGLALADVVVESGGAQSWPRRFWAAPSAPGVFTVSGAGQGQAAVMFAGTTALAAPLGAGEGSRPARAGDVLEIYATGLGAVEPPIADGRNSCAPDGVCLEDGSNAVLRHTVARPRVWIGAYELAPGNIRFSGLAPSLAGMNLVVIEVPPNMAPSPAAELRLAVSGRWSQSGVTIAIE